MVDGAEKLRSCFTKEQENEFKENYKLKEDPRVTPAGRILRKTSLDELPQFFNVLKGEMSIVGPRPVTHEELAKFKEHAEDIISAYPGITGLWQISGRSEVLFIDRVAMDMQYIQNRSFLMDIKIFLKTVYVVIMQRGAF
jgi:lipopolysaccharide/colanic/teichoic acid biosynthesis glycosyltransferase